MQSIILNKENKCITTPDGRILISYIGHDVFQINEWNWRTGTLSCSRCMTRDVLLSHAAEITMGFLLYFGASNCLEIEDLCEVCA